MRRGLLFIPVVILWACSEVRTEAPVEPDTPTPNEIALAPKVPPPPVPNGDGILSIKDVDFSTFSTELAQGLKLEEGELEASVTDKVHAAFKPDNSAPREGHKEYALTELEGLGGSVLVATAQGMADDSVKAKQLYVIFQDEKLVTYGMKVKCWRADNPDQWQNTLCP